MGLFSTILKALESFGVAKQTDIENVTTELQNINNNVGAINGKVANLNFEDGNLLTAISSDNVGLAKDESVRALYPKVEIPLLIDFSKEWHKYVVNYEELNAKVVDLSSEEITIQSPWITKALKFDIGAGETKYLKILIPGRFAEQQIYMWLYLTGDVVATAKTGWTGTRAVLNAQNVHFPIITRLNSWDVTAIEFTATNGGSVYITQIAVPINNDILNLQSYPNQSLDGTTTYTYYVCLPHYGKADGVARVAVIIAGDGTNACNVDVYVLCATDNTYKLIASFSRISSTVGLYQVKFPFKMFSQPQNDIQFINIKLVVSGYGSFQRYSVTTWKYDKLVLPFNGLVTASASNASTTATTYALIDNNGRGNRYINGQINISVPSTGGSAEILINSKTVASYSAGATATFNIPDNIDIWKIEVTLAGDGTNAATADLSALELEGAYIVKR